MVSVASKRVSSECSIRRFVPIKTSFSISNTKRVKFGHHQQPEKSALLGLLECTEKLNYDDMADPANTLIGADGDIEGDILIHPADDEPWPDLYMHDKRWAYSRDIGAGTYGCVGEYHSPDGQRMAIKRLNNPEDPELDIVCFLSKFDNTSWVVDVQCVCASDRKFVAMSMMDGHISDVAGHMSVAGIRKALASFAMAQHDMLVRCSLVYTDLTEKNMMFHTADGQLVWRLVDIGGFAMDNAPGVSTYPIPGEDHLSVPGSERVCLWNIYLMAVMFVCGGNHLRILAHRDAWSTTRDHPMYGISSSSDDDEFFTPPSIRGDENGSATCRMHWRTVALWKYAKNLALKVCAIDPGVGGLLILIVEEICPREKPAPILALGDRLELYANMFSKL